MSEEQLKAFLEKVKGDTSFQEQLNGADVDAVVAIAKAAGFVISADDLKRAQAEISDEELENVAGGNFADWWAKWGWGNGTGPAICDWGTRNRFKC